MWVRAMLAWVMWTGSAVAGPPVMSAPPPVAPSAKPAPPAAEPERSNSLQRIDFSDPSIGGDRSAWLKTPTGPGPWPVIIAFHGGKDRDGTDMVPKLSAAEDRGILLVYANGGPTPKGRGWTGPDKESGDDSLRDVRYTRRLIEELGKKYPIDDDRVYAVGMSGGGYLVDLLWCELSDKLAGFAVISRAMPVVMAKRCEPAAPRPFLLMMGTADDGLVNEHQMSLDDTRSFIREKLACGPMPQDKSTLPDRGDALVVRRTSWLCGGGAIFRDFEVEGGGHTWPGVGKAREDKAEDVDATREILALFNLD